MWLPLEISIPVRIPDFYAVFIRRCLYVTFQIVIFLLQSSHMGLYPWAFNVFPSGGGGGWVGGLEGVMDLNRWVYIGVRGAILAQNIYCANHNPDPGAHSGSRVRRGLGDWYPRSTLE